MPSLCITLPDNKGEITHVLSGQKITIGRRPDNTIQIIHGTVSGYHAELISSAGHYLLHDLGATNMTFVDGEPINDFHLHKNCKISFGSIECEFTLESAKIDHSKPTEVVPTRAELEYLRRENLDLQTQIGVMRKQIDILSAARLTSKATTMIVTPEAHRRMVAERDELRREIMEVKKDTEDLKVDLITMTRDRDALRQAWGTLNAELSRVRAGSEKMASASVGGPAPLAEGVEANAPVAAEGGAPIGAEPVLDAAGEPADPMTQAADSIKAVLDSLTLLSADPGNRQLRDAVSAETAALNLCTESIQGHPVQGLASKLDSFMREIAPGEGSLPAGSIRTLIQTAELMRTLLDPKHLTRAGELTPGIVLTIDKDEDMLAVMNAALHFSDIEMTSSTDPEQALAVLREKHFNLILLDIKAPAPGGAEFYTRLREIPALQKTPVIFFNSTDPLDALAVSNELKGNDFLLQPLDIVEFTLKAHAWICRDQLGLL